MKLGDICEILNGYSFESEKYVSTGIRIIRITNVQKGYIEDNRPCFYPDDFNLQEQYVLREGDILMSLTGNVGRVGILTKEFLPAGLNQRVACLRLKKMVNVNKEYLFSFLNSDYFEELCMKNSKGAAQKNMSTEWLKTVEIPEYNISEQVEIGKIFIHINECIKEKKHQLELYDELTKARFVELFGDYRINNKSFACKKGRELFKFSSGKFLPEEKRLASGIPVYGGNGIAWYTDEPLVTFPTIIVGRVGAQCGNIHAVTTPVWITDNAIYIKEQKTKEYTLEFLTELMRMMDFYQYADFSGQPKITQKPLETLEYIMPPIELQKEYTAFVEQTDKSKFEATKTLEYLEELKSALMAKYFG